MIESRFKFCTLCRADAMMDEHKVEFEKRWQQELVRLKTEQAVYNDQVRTKTKTKTKTKTAGQAVD